MAMNASCLTFVTNADWASLFAMEIEKSCEWLNYNFVWDQESKLSAPGETNNVSETFFFKSYKQQNCLANKFSSPGISVRYNLLQVRPSFPPGFCFRCVIYTFF